MGCRSMTGRAGRKGRSSKSAVSEPRALTIARLAIVLVMGTSTLTASAQSTSAQSTSAQGTPPTAEEIKAARELFQEAFKDEQERRLPEALEKFQRVAKVKETASVRYRIATVLAAMGRWREARDMYRALAAAKPSLPASDHDTSDSAAEKAAELDRRMPRLALRLEDHPPPDVRVTLDGAPVPVSTTPRSIELDPGEHVVAASSSQGTVSEHTLTLPDGGGEFSHTVSFGDRATAGHKDRTLAWIALGGGGALLLGGVALLIAREGAIDDMNTSCPLRVCPASTRSDVESDRDRAQLFGPLGVGLGLIGLAAVGVGVYLLVRNPSSARTTDTSAHPSPSMPTLLPSNLAPRGFVVRF
jgi:hypothetical protein